MVIKKLLVKETFVESISIIVVFTVLQRIIQLARGVIFARRLGPTEYGVYTLAFFFIPLIATFAKLGIPACYERYVPQYEKKGELGDFFKRNYLVTMVAAALLVVLCCFFSTQLSEILYASADYKNLIILSAVTVIFYVLYENFLYSFNGLRIFKIGALLDTSQMLIFTAVGIPMVISYPKAETAIFANLMAYIFIAAIFGFIIWKYILKCENQNLRIREAGFYRKIFRYSAWFIVTPVVFTLFEYTDRWMLNRFLGLRAVGLYSAAANVTGIIFMFGVITGNVLVPNLSKIWEQNDKDKAVSMLNFATRISALVILGGAVTMLLFKKQIISILYGTPYLEGLPLMGVLAVFWLFNSIFWTIKGYGGLVEKTYIPFIGIAAGLLLNVVFNYILIPRYGIMGAGIATMAAFGINLMIIFVLNKKEGMKVELKTMLVCLLPFILLLNAAVAAVVFLIICAAAIRTELIISREEKKLLYEIIKNKFASPR